GGLLVLPEGVFGAVPALVRQTPDQRRHRRLVSQLLELLRGLAPDRPVAVAKCLPPHLGSRAIPPAGQRFHGRLADCLVLVREQQIGRASCRGVPAFAEGGGRVRRDGRFACAQRG